MKNIRNRPLPVVLLPVVLMCAQAAVWPGLALLRGERVEGSALFVEALVIGLGGAALSLRPRRPVLALVVVAAACAVGGAAVPSGGFAVLGTVGVGVALYSVARRGDTPTAWVSAVSLAGWQIVWGVPLHQVGRSHAVDIVLTVSVYTVALGLGMARRRWVRTRTVAVRRLAHAERERRRLPTAERDRLARELHDVSAHHLTAVVVTAEAARNLGNRRPELAAEALDFAARTGREVVDTLGRTPTAPTVTEETSGHETWRLEELAAGFRRLDQPVTVEEVPRILPGSVGEAVHGIVREALTNALRHAPGAPVRVRCVDGDDLVELVIENDAPGDADEATSGLGGGRGLAGMRERARAADGTLTTGAIAGGGWRVRAVFPGHSADVPAPHGSRRRLSSYRLAQLVLAVILCANPLLPVLTSPDRSGPPGADPGASALFALLAGAQALPLLGLRRAPWTVLGAVLAVAVLWLPAGALGAPPVSGGVPVVVSAALLAVAVYGVAAHARTGPGTWAAVALSAGVLAVVVIGTVPAAQRPTGQVLLGVAGTVPVATGLFAAVWMFGRSRRRTRARLVDEENGALAASVTAGVADAYAERQRIVRGLRETVLERVGYLVAEAEAGRLAEVITEARNALDAMRRLLGMLQAEQPAAELGPRPRTEALDLLCRQHRAVGREVSLEGLDRVPADLPTAADLAAFHLVETALSAGDTGPARVILDETAGGLSITVTGTTRATRGIVRERLEAQSQAVGGEITSPPSGSVHIHLPTGLGQERPEEGSPSPSA